MENGKETNTPGFLDHLDALRSVLLKIILIYGLFCLPGWYYSQKMLDLLLGYAAPAGFTLHYFTMMEPFMTRLKIMMVTAFAGTLPFALWWLWGFISPGLTPDERKTLRTPVLSMLFLAAGGAAVCLFLLVPALVAFSLSFAGPDMKPVIGIGSFVSLILTVTLAGMLLFQFPVVLLVLLTTGIVSVDTIRKKRSHVIVIIFILAAVFSPPDVFSQLVLAIPTYLLFEASLLVFVWRSRKNKAGYELYENAGKNDGNSEQ